MGHYKLLEDEDKEMKKRKQFARALAAFYRKYVGDESQSTSSQKKSIQVGRNRERDALERKITAIVRRINPGNEEHNRHYRRMMEEGVMLMPQISELRRQNKNLNKRQRVIDVLTNWLTQLRNLIRYWRCRNIESLSSQNS
jgi:hypothetical protein